MMMKPEHKILSELGVPWQTLGLVVAVACLPLSGCDKSNGAEEEDPSSEESKEDDDSKNATEDPSEDGPEDSEKNKSEEDSNKKSEEDATPEEDPSEEDPSEEDPSKENTPEDEPSEGKSGDDPDDPGDDPDNPGEGDSKRDCDKIKWGKKGLKKGSIVARGDVKGYFDPDGDFTLDEKPRDAGMCELHLTKHRCALMLYGAG